MNRLLFVLLIFAYIAIFSAAWAKSLIGFILRWGIGIVLLAIMIIIVSLR